MNRSSTSSTSSKSAAAAGKAKPSPNAGTKAVNLLLKLTAALKTGGPEARDYLMQQVSVKENKNTFDDFNTKAEALLQLLASAPEPDADEPEPRGAKLGGNIKPEERCEKIVRQVPKDLLSCPPARTQLFVCCKIAIHVVTSTMGCSTGQPPPTPTTDHWPHLPATTLNTNRLCHRHHPQPLPTTQLCPKMVS